MNSKKARTYPKCTSWSSSNKAKKELAKIMKGSPDLFDSIMELIDDANNHP